MVDLNQTIFGPPSKLSVQKSVKKSDEPAILKESSEMLISD